MIRINIDEPASYMNLKALEEIWRESWKLRFISIDYNCRKGLPDKDDIENYPFKAILFAGDDIIVIRIWSLTVGYSGGGPHDTASVLNFFGVRYNEEDIYTKRREGEDGYIRLNYPEIS